MFIRRFEKQLLQPVTRTVTGKLPTTRAANTEASTPNRSNAGGKAVATSTPIVKQVVGPKASAEEIKEKMEQELRQQRAEHHKKRTLEMMQQKKGEWSMDFEFFFYLLRYHVDQHCM